MHGKDLILLHSGASKPEQAEALLEVLERLGLSRLGISRTDLSPGLLARLNRRGRMFWPHKRQTPALAKAPGRQSRDHLSIVQSPTLLSRWMTMGVGGPAQFFVQARSEEEVIATAWRSQVEGLPLFLLGGGSNVVVSDQGVSGIVMKLALLGVKLERSGEHVLATVAAGESWHAFAQKMSREGYAGVECLGGIPGSVGATPVQNVGAYGQEVAETIDEVRALCRDTLEVETFNNQECKFRYRGSLFKDEAKDRYIILSVRFRLKVGGAPSLRYGELTRHFEGTRRSSPSLYEVFEAVVALRRSKSMVLDPSDENSRSCGSFFVNVQVPHETLEGVALLVGQRPPSFEGEAGLVKIPAAWLIERAGFQKGERRGNVGLSSKHTLCIVAHEGATAQEVLGMAHLISSRVQERFGLTLTPEPQFWGFGETDGGLPPLGGTIL
jgi:UDP-N-acetylmuramate dehydrogenase